MDQLSTELSEIAQERRRAKHNAGVAKGEQLSARLGVLRETRELRLAAHRAELAPLEAYMKANTWDLRGAAAFEAAKVRHSSELVPIDTEIAQSIKAMSAPADRGGVFQQWSTPPDATPLQGGEAEGAARSDRTFYPGHSDFVG
jgi:hypothetical protein